MRADNCVSQIEVINGRLHYCGKPVEWAGTPERYKSGEEYAVKITLDRAPEQRTPRLGELVRVQGRKGADFIAPIIAIRNATPTIVHAVTDYPPWIDESYVERRERRRVDALKKSRTVAVRESLGLCIICGAEPQACACVVRAEAAAKESTERLEAERAELAGAEARKKLVEENELHNRNADQARANLTVDDVKAAVLRNKGNLKKIGADLGVEKYSGWGLSPTFVDKEQKPYPASAFLVHWFKKNAPELSALAAELRATKA